VPQTKANSIQYINKLRILAIYMVVVAHVAMWQTMATKSFTFNWWLGCWLFHLAHFSIPVFVMISGALLLDDSRRESAAQFYRRRLVRVGIPLVVWTGVYLAVRVVLDKEQLSVGRAVTLILTGDPYYHLWFLYMIVGLYLITPPLRTFIRSSSRAERILVIVVGLVLANAYFQTDVLLWNNQRSIFTMFIPYIAYYLCGYELRRIDPRTVPSRYLILVVLIVAAYMAAFSGVFMDIAGGVGTRYLFGFFDPPVIFISIGIFWAAYLRDATARPLTGRARTALGWVSSTVMGVYVLHPLVLDLMAIAFSKQADEGNFVAGVIVVPLVTFVACYLITSLLMNVPILRRTVC
jgi:surface polysaccharide O-acyltransferase-like enzyme